MTFFTSSKKIILCLFLVLAILINHALVTAQPNSFATWPSHSIKSFSFTFFLLLGVLVFMGGFVRSPLKSSIWISIFYIFLGLISFAKRKTLGGPLFPTDFYAFVDAERALRFNESLIQDLLAAGIFAAFTLLVFFIGLQVQDFQIHHLKKRLGLFFVGTLMIGILTLKHNPIHDHLFSGPFLFDQRQPVASMEELGMVVSFIALIEQGDLIPPFNYSPKRMNDLWTTANQMAEKSLAKNATTLRPDIIVVMSESLFDPTQLSGIQWNRDPLKFTRSLTKENFNRLIVPTFGGKTANTEFSFLTGHQQRFLSAGTVAYNRLIVSSMDSIPSQLNELGYNSIAIHPGERKFWNRNYVYPLMGFERFIDIDQFSESTLFAGYPTDESILPILQQSLLDRKAPQFRFVVTIQNHWPFYNAFDTSDMAFKKDGLDPDEVVALNHYVHGLEITDRFHQKLVAWLQQRSRPTVLMIFGDHLPSLLPNFKVYKGRFIHDENIVNWTIDEKIKMNRTPLVLWSNVPLEYPSGNVSAPFAGVKLLETLGLPLSPYQSFLAKVGHQLPTLSRYLPKDPTTEEKSIIDDYAALQYLILSGQQNEQTLSSKSNPIEAPHSKQ